ncbi:hypothetical protein TNCV_2307361 [Trichonephila clavipes]|nr:hypothetical protein TNCV_2307361 [Trichonephila clavipes]
MGGRLSLDMFNVHRLRLHDESRFTLWDHDGCIRVPRYASERCRPDNRNVREVLQPEVIPSLQGIHEAIFQQPTCACPHVAKTVRDFCSA